MEEVKIWMRRPKEVILTEIHKLKSDYSSSKLSFRYYHSNKEKKKYAQYKAFYFCAILFRERLLRKKLLKDQDITQIQEILNRKFSFLSSAYLSKCIKVNFFSLKALEDNWSREAQK